MPERGWGFASIEAMNEQISKGLVEFRKDESEPPFRKAYLLSVEDDCDDSDNDLIGAQVMPSIIYKQAQVSVKFLRNLFGGNKVFDNPKDHEVLMRLIKYVTGPNDIVLDSFAGSGPTGHAILQLNKETGGSRKFILIEMDKNIFHKVTRERVKRAVEGYTYKSNVGKEINKDGFGSGFRLCCLDRLFFNDKGDIANEVTFTDLAAFVYFIQTGEPIPKLPARKTPLLGVHNGTAVYLLYNGILGDKTPGGGNVLTRSVLAGLPPHHGPRVVFGTGCRISGARLNKESIVFRQIPYELRMD